MSPVLQASKVESSTITAKGSVPAEVGQFIAKLAMRLEVLFRNGVNIELEKALVLYACVETYMYNFAATSKSKRAQTYCTRDISQNPMKARQELKRYWLFIASINRQ